jgi:lipid-A-disaccharide synthase
MFSAGRRLQTADAKVHFHLGVAHTIDLDWAQSMVERSGLNITLHRGAVGALKAASVAVVGAGTASLEAALAGRPVLVLGRLNPLTALIGRRLVRTPHFALPNLVLGRRVFEEIIQESCTERAVVDGLDRLLRGANPPGRWLDELRTATKAPNGMAGANVMIEEVLAGRGPARTRTGLDDAAPYA